MRSTRLAVLPLLALVVAACGASGPSPSAGAASPTPPPPTPVGATPAASDVPSGNPSGNPSGGAPADGLGYWLRMTTTQAIPPIQLFQVSPAALITSDGLDLVPGAIPMIYPGPLVGPIFGRQLSDAGREQIVGWARELGLLDGKTDFTDGQSVPGGITGILELTVDGSLLKLTGPIDAPTDGSPPKGSPGAFTEFWNRVSSLPETLQGELGPEQPYEPIGYALLVGPPPSAQGIKGNLQDWPLDAPIASYGTPVADGTVRCGTSFGDDAAALGHAFENANQLSQWVQDPDTSATFGLTVRPIVPGENPCKELFGV
jgi:hypothetical protein